MGLYWNMPSGLKDHYLKELQQYKEELNAGNFPAAWRKLERAHILGQPWPREHTWVHWLMLIFGIKIKSLKEIIGQIPRLLMGGIKSFVGNIPVGNTGGANVPPLQSMEVPADIKKIMAPYWLDQQNPVELLDTKKISNLYHFAATLIAFTIIYNLIEGLVSVYLGFEDESLTLFGFGVDSFIEVMSGIGVAHMIYRIQKNSTSNRDDFEKRALRITGISFYLLVVGLVITSLYNIWTKHNPEATFWGIIISAISILVMWALILGKTYVGRKLNSPAILADAQCTKVCIYMSVILLVSSVFYEYTKVPYIDSVGTLGLAYFSFKEGKECFEKTRSNNICSGDCC